MKGWLGSKWFIVIFYVDIGGVFVIKKLFSIYVLYVLLKFWYRFCVIKNFMSCKFRIYFILKIGYWYFFVRYF